MIPFRASQIPSMFKVMPCGREAYDSSGLWVEIGWFMKNQEMKSWWFPMHQVITFVKHLNI